MFWDKIILWSYYGPVLDSQSISTLVIVVPARYQWDCLISAVEYTSKKFCLLENKYFGKMGDSYNSKWFAGPQGYNLYLSFESFHDFNYSSWVLDMMMD